MSRLARIAAVTLALVLAAVPQLQGQELPSPEEFFGHRMGAEGEIVDYFRSLEYYRLLAERSERMLYRELGETTAGNPLVLLVISSPANLADLERLRAGRDRLSDPRALDEEEALRLAAELPAVVLHAGSIHSSEISCAQVPPELVHLLVSDDSPHTRRILDNVVVLVIPTQNPDGQVMYSEWYGEHRGQPWEGRMPWLYHPYVGHDNNRDWILLHFPEQRLTATEVFNAWHPIYSIEMHQMGATGARIFVPPYKDPHDPNTAPQVVETMSLIGMAMSHRLTAEGRAGVVKGAIFDLYTPARAYQVNHGTARILTETASADFASAREVPAEELQSPGARDYDPRVASWNFPLPWPGGLWTFREMVEYQLSANLAALELAAANRVAFNTAYYRALRRACEGEGWPYAYVVPPGQRDPGAAALLLRALQRGEIEIHRATAPFEAGGREFAAGSHVILLRQPYGAWAKSLLEVQHYPDLRRSPAEPPLTPYDTTANTLPLLMGVEAVEVPQPFEAELEPVNAEIGATGRVSGGGEGGFAILPCSNDAYAVADGLLDEGFSVARLRETVESGEAVLPAGSFIAAPAPNLADRLREAAAERAFTAVGLPQPLPPDARLADLRDPRIGLYIPWGGNMDAGWTRLVLERWGLEYAVVRNADLRAGELRARLDVIIFPDGLSTERILEGGDEWPEEYAGGIGDEGLAALIRFLRRGGSVVAFGRTSMTLAELLELPVANRLEELEPPEHYCPGTILLVELDAGSPLAYGLPDKVAVMSIRGPAFEPAATTEAGPQMAAVYPEYDPLLSGYLIGPQHLRGAGAVAVQPLGGGGGHAILFAFRPQFRAMTHGTYRLLFNAVFWAAESGE